MAIVIEITFLIPNIHLLNFNMTFYNISPYDKNKFKRDPYAKKIAQQVYKIFDNVALDFNVIDDRNLFQGYNPGDTPRDQYINAILPFRRFNMSIFYYLKFLNDINPDIMLDVGCGGNLFKKIYTNVYGIDPQCITTADLVAKFDDNYVKNNIEKYTCAFAINSLHMISITLMHDRILKFANIIKPGGRGFLTLSSKRMIEHTTPLDCLKIFNTTTPTTLAISDYCNKVITNLPLNLLVAENLITKCEDDTMNGNIRLVFEK